jgi:hypothetical protein
MNPLITKADLLLHVDISANMPENKINIQIKDMQTYDLEGKFTDNLLAAFYSLPSIVPDPEDQPELRTFYNDYVKRYLCLLTYHRILAKHGINMTQFGMTQTKDPAGTFDPVAETRRAVLMKSTLSDSNVALTLLNKQLGKVNYTLDGIVYAIGQDVTPRIGISAIKKPDSTTRNSYYKRFL